MACECEENDQRPEAEQAASKQRAAAMLLRQLARAIAVYDMAYSCGEPCTVKDTALMCISCRLSNVIVGAIQRLVDSGHCGGAADTNAAYPRVLSIVHTTKETLGSARKPAILYVYALMEEARRISEPASPEAVQIP